MLRGGTQAASFESRTLFLPASGISAQNMRSRMSACDSTITPAFDNLSSWTRRIWRSVSICRLMCSIISWTALTLTSPREYRSSANLIAMFSAAFIRSGVSLAASEVASELCAARLSSNCARLTLAPSGALLSSTASFSCEAFGSCIVWPKWVSRRIVWITSSSCRDTTPPVHGPLDAATVPAAPPGTGILGTLPIGAPPATPPALAP